MFTAHYSHPLTLKYVHLSLLTHSSQEPRTPPLRPLTDSSTIPHTFVAHYCDPHILVCSSSSSPFTQHSYLCSSPFFFPYPSPEPRSTFLRQITFLPFISRVQPITATLTSHSLLLLTFSFLRLFSTVISRFLRPLTDFYNPLHVLSPLQPPTHLRLVILFFSFLILFLTAPGKLSLHH